MIWKELDSLVKADLETIVKYLIATQHFCLQFSKLNKTETIEERKQKTNGYGICGMAILYQFYKRNQIHFNCDKLPPLQPICLSSESPEFCLFLKSILSSTENQSAKQKITHMISWMEKYHVVRGS